MKKAIFVFVFIVFIGGTFLILNKTNQVVAEPSRAVTAGNIETWVIGVTSEGETAYSSLAGRVITTVAGFRADRGVNDQYFIFPAPAEEKKINAASVNLVSMSGSASTSVNLTLEAYDLNGNWLRNVSQPIDLMLLNPNGWADFELSQTVGDVQIQSGEVLIAHLVFPETGDLELQCIFDVEVE